MKILRGKNTNLTDLTMLECTLFDEKKNNIIRQPNQEMHVIPSSPTGCYLGHTPLNNVSINQVTDKKPFYIYFLGNWFNNHSCAYLNNSNLKSRREGAREESKDFVREKVCEGEIERKGKIYVYERQIFPSQQRISIIFFTLFPPSLSLDFFFSI
jgi:hypothetical protein